MIDPYNIFQDVQMENMAKTVLPHVVIVLDLMYVQKQMVLAQETVPLVLKDCNVLLVLWFCSFIMFIIMIIVNRCIL